MPTKLQERNFSGTPYVPVYVMLPVSKLILLKITFTFYIYRSSFLSDHI